MNGMINGERIKGVNLGNWLVLEKWMQPSLFEGTDAEDEIWLGRTLPRHELEEKLKAHRESYVTEEDFATIADHGFNLVRIPVPYFIFGDRSEGVGCVEYLDRAMVWAAKHNLKVLIDLHTVPGSQNGYDNGGITGVCKWCRNPDEVKYALHVLRRLAERYGQNEALFGIEVLNEPISFFVWISSPSFGKAKDKAEARGSSYVPIHFLQKFYRCAYKLIRRYLPEEKAVVFHDGFRLDAWNSFFDHADMKNVYLDTHIYISAMESFVPAHKPWAYQRYMDIEAARIRRVNRHVPVIVGEWTLTNKYALDETDPEKRREKFHEIEAMQRKAWQEGAGSIYWNYQLNRNLDEPMDELFKESWALNRCWKYGWTSE